MSVLRRAIAAAAVCAVTSSVLAGGGLAAAAPAVVNGDLAFSETNGVVTQAPRESTYHYAAEGNQAKYSPDGRRIAYTSASGSVGYGIWVKTLGSTTQRQLGTQPVSGLAWSPDGGSLVVASGNQLLRVKVSTGAAVPIFTGSGELRDPAWSPDGTRIAFTAGARIQLVRPSGERAAHLHHRRQQQPRRLVARRHQDRVHHRPLRHRGGRPGLRRAGHPSQLRPG